MGLERLRILFTPFSAAHPRIPELCSASELLVRRQVTQPLLDHLLGGLRQDCLFPLSERTRHFLERMNTAIW